MGIESIFDRPGYTEFRIRYHQHELGDRQQIPARRFGAGPAGTDVCGQVVELPATLNRLLSMGAKEHEAPADSG